MDTLISTNYPIAAVTLGECIERLGSRTVTLLGGGDTKLPVLGTEFYDVFDELPEQEGTLLIVPSGMQLHVSELSQLAAEAARLNYAALALKCAPSSMHTLTAIAETSGIPILRVVESVGWRLFEALVGTLLGEQRANEETHFDRGLEPLFALVNELAEVFGGSVVIEDLGRRVIAYSSVPGQRIDALRTQGILARKVPASPFNDDQYLSVLRSDAPIRYPQLDDELPRAACAIRAGALPLGTIWAIEAEAMPSTIEQQTAQLQRAATIAASHMIDDLRVRTAGQAPRENLLRTLLTGTAVTGTELAELGIAEEHGALMLAFELRGLSHPTAIAQLRSTVHRHLALHHPETVTAVCSGRVYSLISHENEQTLPRTIEPLVPMLDRLVGNADGEQVRLAAPGVAHRSSEITVLREQAEWLFNIAKDQPQTEHNRLLTIDTLRPQLLLERIRELLEHTTVLAQPKLTALIKEQPQLASTVQAWCEAFGNIARTALAERVHENTIRYRLKRAEEHYGVSLDTPDSLLTTWVQLRVGKHPFDRSH